jgi:transcriptional regulator
LYIPEYNRIDDDALTLAFMQANPFAVLVSDSDVGLIATHLPVVSQMVSGEFILRAHVAKANQHWKALEQARDSLVIFHGPHAFISPSLYEARESVPTWTYAVVHAYGRGRILSDESDAVQVLHDLIAAFDAPYLAQWASVGEQYRQRMIRNIVAFEIQATRAETKFKLNQNRTQVDQECVIQALAQSADSAVTEIARLMRERGLGAK